MMDIARKLDLTKGTAAATLHRMRMYGLIVRASRGLYALPASEER
jgi:Mn-dependent DtxR family transcriptional regulator